MPHQQNIETWYKPRFPYWMLFVFPRNKKTLKRLVMITPTNHRFWQGSRSEDDLIYQFL